MTATVKEDLKITLDSIDIAILQQLQLEARLSNKELAARVGLAPSSCLERVKRLQVNGILKGFHAYVEPSALGIHLQAMVQVRLGNHSRAMLEQFREHVLAMPEVISLYYVSGTEDFLVHVAAKDSNQLRDFTIDSLANHPGVVHLETSIVFEYTHRAQLPTYLPGWERTAKVPNQAK
jgi:DNA-binding Lrp family transcriptional regulator